MSFVRRSTASDERKGLYAGRRGSETEMNRTTNGNSQITSHLFGHTKAVADSHYVKPLPDESAKAALDFDRRLGDAIAQGLEAAIN